MSTPVPLPFTDEHCFKGEHIYSAQTIYQHVGSSRHCWQWTYMNKWGWCVKSWPYRPITCKPTHCTTVHTTSQPERLN